MHGNRLLSIGLIGLAMLSSGPVAAQRPLVGTSAFQNARPPIYDLFQERRGILPNFYQYYLPQRQLQQNLRMQELQLQRQGTAIQSLRNQWSAPSQGDAAISPTGRGSVFMNYSHYYPALGSSRR